MREKAKKPYDYFPGGLLHKTRHSLRPRPGFLHHKPKCPIIHIHRTLFSVSTQFPSISDIRLFHRSNNNSVHRLFNSNNSNSVNNSPFHVIHPNPSSILPQWSRITKNPDVSTGPLSHLFTCPA